MKRCQRGFSLLDVSAALFVTVTMMLSSCMLLIGSRRLSQQSQIQGASYEVARQELEVLRSYKFENRTATASTSFTIPSSVSSQFPEQSFAGTYSVQSYASYSSQPMQQVVVKVTWSRIGIASGVTSSVQLDSLVTQEPGR